MSIHFTIFVKCNLEGNHTLSKSTVKCKGSVEAFKNNFFFRNLDYERRQANLEKRRIHRFEFGMKDTFRIVYSRSVKVLVVVYPKIEMKGSRKSYAT